MSDWESPIVAKTIQTRRRINLKQTAAGKMYYDITVEMYGDNPDDILNEVDALKVAVEERYGNELAGGK